MCGLDFVLSTHTPREIHIKQEFLFNLYKEYFPLSVETADTMMVVVSKCSQQTLLFHYRNHNMQRENTPYLPFNKATTPAASSRVYTIYWLLYNLQSGRHDGPGAFMSRRTQAACFCKPRMSPRAKLIASLQFLLQWAL